MRLNVAIAMTQEILSTRAASRKKYLALRMRELPDIFCAGTVWAISKAAADVLRQFDLGGGGLYPVKVFKKDQQTPVVASGSASISATGKRRSCWPNPFRCVKPMFAMARRPGASGRY
jgi:hypothetical protein